METDSTFVRWVELPEQEPVKFGALPRILAAALHAEPFAQAAAEINLQSELRGLVNSGALMVRDSLTLGRHPFPVGDALRRAVLLPNEDLRPLLESRGIGLRLTRYGTGPNLWTIGNAAASIAAQEGWHQSACDTLRLQMLQAAQDGLLTVRHPHSALVYRPETVHDFYELVTPSDVNAWLQLDPGLALRWAVEGPAPAVADATPPVEDGRSVTPTWQDQARREARRIRQESQEQGRYPPLKDLGDKVAQLFRERGITGPNGHALTGAYIKRHALQRQGITKDADRLKAGLNTRGK